MNERDAKRTSLEVHRREIAVVRGYVNCTTCACNYSAAVLDRREPTFCQIYSTQVDPSATAENISRAERCKQWVHMNLDRSQVVTPDHAYRYDHWGD